MEQTLPDFRNGSIEIPRSKRKLMSYFLLSAALAAGGVWLLITPIAPEHSPFGTPAVIYVAGVLSAFFFTLAALALAARLRVTRPGLTINSTGITDNSSSASVGVIPWSDVRQIAVTTMYRQVLIVIAVRNPQEYINRHAGGFKREALTLNNQLYGSPCVISALSLRVNSSRLVELLNGFFAVHGTNPDNTHGTA